MDNMSQIELSIEQAKESISNKRALVTLLADKNFIKIIMEGYFKEEASRLVLFKATPQMQSPENQLSINKQIDSIGHFNRYLGTIEYFGDEAEKALVADEQTREELEAEVA